MHIRMRSKLATYLPLRVREKDGSAKWLADKSVLCVTLPVIRDEW